MGHGVAPMGKPAGGAHRFQDAHAGPISSPQGRDIGQWPGLWLGGASIGLIEQRRIGQRRGGGNAQQAPISEHDQPIDVMEPIIQIGRKRCQHGFAALQTRQYFEPPRGWQGMGVLRRVLQSRTWRTEKGSAGRTVWWIG